MENHNLEKLVCIQLKDEAQKVPNTDIYPVLRMPYSEALEHMKSNPKIRFISLAKYRKVFRTLQNKPKKGKAQSNAYGYHTKPSPKGRIDVPFKSPSSRVKRRLRVLEENKARGINSRQEWRRSETVRLA